jgi:chromosome segregation ATPase
MSNNILNSIEEVLPKYRRNETSDIVENIKKQYEEEMKKLKEDNNAFTNKGSSFIGNTSIIENEKNLQKKDETIKKQNKKIEELMVLLSEERELQNENILRIKILEETLKKLDREYENLVNKYTETNKENDTIHKALNQYKANFGDNKSKFEELISINSELKEKIIQNENSIKTHLDDIKSLLKKNALLTKHNEEFDKQHKLLTTEVASKDEKLKVIRHMNNKLEQKSQQILKKWDIFKAFEEKSKEDTDKASRLLETIEDLNKSLHSQTREIELLKRKLDMTANENLKYNVEVDELRKHISNLKQANEELLNKNNELEQKFKRSLEQRNTDSRDNSIVIQNKEKGKTYHSMALKNLNMANYSITNLISQQEVNSY